MFSNSRIPYHLVNWVISQGEVIRDVDAPLNSTPASFIEDGGQASANKIERQGDEPNPQGVKGKEDGRK
ncbi:hypothetical protein YC2023_073749 [Brassica napus]